ncbi:MAG: FAD-dependent oxidoreductase [Bilophila wadsworthia]
MQELSEYTKRHWDVVVIGGGATGAGTLRDLAMRGVKALLLEQRDLVHGTSSRFHGLLHSGARYAVKDAEAGRECIEENRILRRIGKHCVEETEGFFVRTPEDGAEFEATWVTACDKCGIEATPLTVKEARALEPNLADNIVSVYRVPDSAVDGFRLVWQNVQNAVRHGAGFRTYTEVTSINSANGQVTSVSVRDSRTGQTGEIPCSFVVNAAGSWVGELAHTAGLDINVKPDRGTLVAFNHRFTSRVINRLRKASDGDIFVPHGSITILGTTSKKTDKPDDTVPDTAEVHELLDIGRVLFPEIDSYRILRTFAGTRPLYTADPSAEGRGASRNFVVLDHEKEGLKGMATICGGKLTTYRLMGERMTDLVCAKLGVAA